jgi:hypothetical protein
MAASHDPKTDVQSLVDRVRSVARELTSSIETAVHDVERSAEDIAQLAQQASCPHSHVVYDAVARTDGKKMVISICETCKHVYAFYAAPEEG